MTIAVIGAGASGMMAALTAAEIKPFVESGHVCAGNGVDRYAGENGGVPVCPVKMPTAGDWF